MVKRIITAILIAAVGLPIILLGGNYLDILVCILTIPIVFEITSIRIFKKRWLLMLLSWGLMITLFFCAPKNVGYYIGIFFVGGFILPILDSDYKLLDILTLLVLTIVIALAMNGVRLLRIFSLPLTLIIVLATYGTDAFAYFGGYFFGKTKLVPYISPKKTVEGAISGWIGGTLFLLITLFIFTSNLNFFLILIISFSIPLVAQIGDLTFSLVKRNYNLKDFGSVFPGHGGVLDRIDSLVFTLMFTNFVINMIGIYF